MIPAPPVAAPPPSGPATWPGVIGIVAVIFGAAALLHSALGAASSSFVGGFVRPLMQAAPVPQVTTVQFEVMDRFRPAILAVTAVGAVVAAGLLAAGIGLLRRRRWCRWMVLAWAGAKIIASIGTALVNHRLMTTMFEAMQEAAVQSGLGPGQMPPSFFGMMVGMATVGTIVQLLWLWALPVFMIAWFSRPAIGAEIRAWPSGTPLASSEMPGGPPHDPGS